MRSREAKIERFNRTYAKYALEGMTAFDTYLHYKALGYFVVDIARKFDIAPNSVSRWERYFADNKIDSLS